MRALDIAVCLAAIACTGGSAPESSAPEPSAPESSAPAPAPVRPPALESPALDAGAPGAQPVAPSSIWSDARDHYGDPLPEHAVRRLGMARLLQRGGVQDLAWTPDGTRLVSSGAGPVHLWRIPSGRREARAVTVPGRRVDIHPDGRWLAAADAGGDLVILDLHEDRVAWRYEPPIDRVLDVAFSPDGDRLALGCERGVQLMEATTGVRVARWLDHRGPVDRIAWSPDGTSMASVDRTGLGILRELSSGEVRATFHLDEAGTPIPLLRWSPDGRLLATGTRHIEIRRGSTGEWVRDLPGSGSLTGAAFLADGAVLVASFGGSEPRLAAWDVTAGEPTRAPAPLREPPSAVAISPDGRRIAIGDLVGGIHLRDAGTGRPLGERVGHDAEITALAVRSDGTVYTGGADRRILSWSPADGAPRPFPAAHQRPVTTLDLPPDGGRLLSAGWDGQAIEWDTSSRTRRRTLTHGGPTHARYGAGSELVTWSAREGLRRHPGSRPSLPATREVFAPSPDGSRIAAIRDDSVVLLDAGTGEQVAALEALEGAGRGVQELAWSPDGHLLASVSADGRIRVVDSRTNTLVRAWSRPGAITSVTWSPDGRRLATGHARAVVLWDLGSDRPVAERIGHDGWVTALAWPHPGRLLSGSADRTVLVWEAPPAPEPAGFGYGGVPAP